MRYLNWVKGVIFFNVGIIAFTACQNKQAQVDVMGTALESTQVLVSQILPDQIKPIDTVEIVDGTFGYSFPFEGPEFMLFEFSSKLRVPMLIKPQDKINLAVVDTGSSGYFIATGTKSAVQLTTQSQLFVGTLRVIDSLDQLAVLYQDSANYMQQRALWNAAFTKRLDFHRAKLFEFFTQDSTELANIMAFYQGKGGFELLRFPQDERYFKMVDNGLMASMPDDKHVRFFHKTYTQAIQANNRQQRIEAAAQSIKVGNMAPEIALPTPEGTILKLSSLRGKVVLIDFWASWCGPCRRANPELVKIYNSFKDRGFDVFSVSIDGVKNQNNAKNQWQEAIAADGLVWPNHVSDLKGNASQVIDMYGFNGIPFTVLIDGTGEIVAKNIHGQQLVEKLEAIL